MSKGLVLFCKVKILGSVKTKNGIDNIRLVRFERSDGYKGEKEYTDSQLTFEVKSFEKQGIEVREIECNK